MVPRVLSQLSWHSFVTVVLSIAVLILDIFFLFVYPPLPASKDCTSAQFVARVVFETLAYSSWIVSFILPLGHLAHLGLLSTIRRTRFYQNVVKNIEDPRVEMLLPSQWDNPTITHWLWWGVGWTCLIVQGFVSTYILRSPDSSSQGAFIETLSTHAKYSTLAAIAFIVVLFGSLATLHYSIATLFRRNTDETYRFKLGGISRLLQRAFFTLFVYLIILDICLFIFDTTSTIHNITVVQVRIFSFIDISIGCICLFGATFSLLAEYLARWAEDASQIQEKPGSCRVNPYFLPILNFVFLPFAMILTGTICLDQKGPSFDGLLSGLVPAAISIGSGVLVFCLDISLCYAVVYLRRRNNMTSHTRLPQQDPDNEENIGLVRTISTPMVIITSEEGGDSRFVLDEDEGEGEESDEGEFEPLLDS